MNCPYCSVLISLVKMGVVSMDTHFCSTLQKMNHKEALAATGIDL